MEYAELILYTRSSRMTHVTQSLRCPQRKPVRGAKRSLTASRWATTRREFTNTSFWYATSNGGAVQQGHDASVHPSWRFCLTIASRGFFLRNFKVDAYMRRWVALFSTATWRCGGQDPQYKHERQQTERSKALHLRNIISFANHRPLVMLVKHLHILVRQAA